jgi:hypothetical protein
MELLAELSLCDISSFWCKAYPTVLAFPDNVCISSASTYTDFPLACQTSFLWKNPLRNSDQVVVDFMTRVADDLKRIMKRIVCCIDRYYIGYAIKLGLGKESK